MRDPFLRPFSSSDPSNDSWLNRIRENLGQLLIPAHFKPTSANGAPIHLLKFDKSLRPARAQGASFLSHAAIFAAVLFIVTGPPRTPRGPSYKPPGRETILAPFLRSFTGVEPSDGGGRGGANNPTPPTHGTPFPYSSLVLVKPSLPQNRESQLPVPPTFLDPNAAPVLTPTPDPGLPWMTPNTNSGGPGPGHTIGSVGGDNVGDRGPGPFGDSESTARYGPGFIAPMCAYCPIPTYTDDARHVKVQGTVTLQVLVGADGRAQDIRIIKGVGYGLDERAVETIRGWKFIPAHDSSKRTVAAWVTIEAVFRLF
jgi:periplasmic protein TonB